jgi:hypothetical protein
MQVDFDRLANLLQARLDPALPDRVRVRAARGRLVVWTEGFRGWSELLLDFTELGGPAPPTDFAWSLHNGLTQLADEASDATANRYDYDIEVENGVVRLWFGRIPNTPPPPPSRHVLPELEPIPLAAFTGGGLRLVAGAARG